MQLGLWIALGVGGGAAIGAATQSNGDRRRLGAAFGVALGSIFSGGRG